MTEAEKYDEKIREMIRQTELVESPEGLNERIMEEVRHIPLKKTEKKFSFISVAWILLIGALVLLPFLLNLLNDYLSSIEINGNLIPSVAANNTYLILIIFLAGSLLLLAERLIKLSFRGIYS